MDEDDESSDDEMDVVVPADPRSLRRGTSQVGSLSTFSYTDSKPIPIIAAFVRPLCDVQKATS